MQISREKRGQHGSDRCEVQVVKLPQTFLLNKWRFNIKMLEKNGKIVMGCEITNNYLFTHSKIPRVKLALLRVHMAPL